MVVAVAVADLDRHAAVEAVGYGLGAFAGFEAFNGRLVDYVVGTWGLGHGGDDVADVEVFDDFAVLAGMLRLLLSESALCWCSFRTISLMIELIVI